MTEPPACTRAAFTVLQKRPVSCRPLRTPPGPASAGYAALSLRSRWLLFALLVGLVARLAFEVQLAPYPRHERLANALDDQTFLVDWAAAMARGERLDLQGSPHEWAYWAARQSHLPPQAPLYPALLALLSLVLGSAPQWIRAAQVAAGLATIAGVFLVARRRFGETAATLAALGAALYAPWIFFEATVLRTSGLVLLFVAIVVAFDRLAPIASFAARPQKCLALGTGALCGLAVLFQEQFLLLWIVGALWLARRRAGGARWVLAGGAAVLLPVVLVASLTAGRLVASTASAPFNLLIANLHDANGRVPATTPAYDAFKRTQAQPATVPVPSSALLRALARDLGQHPLAWPRLLARKAAYLLRPVEIPDNVNYDLGRRENPALRWAPFDYPMLLPLALVGLALARSATPAVAPMLPLAAAYALSLLVFVPLARLRQPLALVVLVFAGAGAAELWRRLRARPGTRRGHRRSAARRRQRAATGDAGRDPARPTGRWRAAPGRTKGTSGRRAEISPAARAAFVQAMVRNPRAVRARAALVALDLRLGRPDLAPLAPAAAALCAEGSRAAQRGDLEAALRAFDGAARQAPRHPRPWHLLANVHFLQADRAAATLALERAVELDPYDALLGGNLAVLRGLAGDWTPRASLP